MANEATVLFLPASTNWLMSDFGVLRRLHRGIERSGARIVPTILWRESSATLQAC